MTGFQYTETYTFPGIGQSVAVTYHGDDATGYDPDPVVLHTDHSR